MTNRQLFWVARVVVEYRKVHRHVSFAIQFLINFYNEHSLEHDVKKSQNFQEAFGCKNEEIDEDEILISFNELADFGLDVEDFEKLYENLKFLG